MNIQYLSIKELQPNDYNPNVMTDAEFQEFTAEVKHLGKLPKPVVVRPNGNGYIIIDGEHAWRAAQEVGLDNVPCEIIEADDFEAMRQTYKRNQHGRHDPLKQGYMFKRMMAERGLSQRQLADEMELSEGTVRNSCAYVEAVELRNSCADYTDHKRENYSRIIASLPIRTVRALNDLPRQLADLWMNVCEHMGGEGSLELPNAYGNYDRQMAELIPYMHFNICGANTCNEAIKRMKEYNDALRLWGFSQRVWGRRGQEHKWTGGLKLNAAEALPYMKAYLKSRWCEDRDSLFLSHSSLRSVLEAISRPTGEKAKIILPFETFTAWIDYPEPMSQYNFVHKLEEATAEIAPAWDDAGIWAEQLKNYAPAVIKNSGLPTQEAYKLWQSLRTHENDGVKKEILDEALKTTIAVFQDVTKEHGKDPDELFGEIVRELNGDNIIEAELTSLGDKAQMLESVKELLTYLADKSEMFSAMFGDLPHRRRAAMLKKSMQPMLDRLAALQEPELALITAMLTGKDALKIWATALGWNFGKKDDPK